MAPAAMARSIAKKPSPSLSLLVAATEQPEYKKNDAGQPTSFGVVSLVGDEQALEIDSLLRSHLSPDRYEPTIALLLRKCRPVPRRRGAIVIFVSLVDTAQRGAASPSAIKNCFKQRF